MSFYIFQFSYLSLYSFYSSWKCSTSQDSQISYCGRSRHGIQAASKSTSPMAVMKGNDFATTMSVDTRDVWQYMPFFVLQLHWERFERLFYQSEWPKYPTFANCSQEAEALNPNRIKHVRGILTRQVPSKFPRSAEKCLKRLILLGLSTSALFH